MDSRAAQRIVVAGWLEETVAADFSHALRPEPGDGVTALLDDPFGELAGVGGSHVRLTVELTNQANDGPPHAFSVLKLHPPTAAAPQGLPASGDPGRFAGPDNGLYPQYDEPLAPLDAAAGPPPSPDSDADGVPDDSDDFPDDPNESVDTDGDGVGNNQDDDDDGDGMTDAYEAANGLQRLVDDAALDEDGDGRPNREEFVAGTRADDPSSRFAVTSVEPLPGGQVALAWDAVGGRVYSILETPDLVTPPVAIRSSITPPGDATHVETVTPAADSAFFLIEVSLEP